MGQRWPTSRGCRDAHQFPPAPAGCSRARPARRASAFLGFWARRLLQTRQNWHRVTGEPATPARVAPRAKLMLPLAALERGRAYRSPAARPQRCAGVGIREEGLARAVDRLRRHRVVRDGLPALRGENGRLEGGELSLGLDPALPLLVDLLDQFDQRKSASFIVISCPEIQVRTVIQGCHPYGKGPAAPATLGVPPAADAPGTLPGTAQSSSR